METNDLHLPIICITDSQLEDLQNKINDSFKNEKDARSTFESWADEGNFPVNVGYFVLRSSEDSNDKAIVKFDITDLSNSKIEAYQTLNGQNDCFLKATIKNLNHAHGSKADSRHPRNIDNYIDIEYMSISKSKFAILPRTRIMEEVENDDSYKIAIFQNFIGAGGKKPTIKLIEIETDKYVCKRYAIGQIPALLVVMYYMVQNKPTFLTAKARKELIEYTSIKPYRYDCYIDLRKSNNVYTVATDKNGKVRQFTRHIESWSVRGHSRTYKKTGQTVWVGGYTKGFGELEQRTYATVDKSELDLPVKVFNVPSTTLSSEIPVIYNVSETGLEIEIIKESVPCEDFSKDTPPRTNMKISIFKRIANKLKSWF